MSKNSEKYLFFVLITSLFIQIWFDVLGFTVRLEDLIAILFVVFILLRLNNGYRLKTLNRFDWIILWFALILIISMLNTIISGYSIQVKKDALINGTRIILCLLSFFVAYDLIKNKIISLEAILKLLIGISFLTTTISLIQILYWDGALPFGLPSMLTTLKEGANVEQGREIFGLYIGDTGSHKWSAMLSVQIMVVFFYLAYIKKKKHQFFLGAYLLVMFYILLHISVRNSILGVIISIVAVLFLNNLPKRNFNIKDFSKAIGVLFISIITLIGIVIILPEDNYYVQRFLSAIPKFGSDGIEVDRASNIVGRLYYWFFAWTLFLENPFLGSGLYSYEYLSMARSAMPTVHAHNSYFNYLAETGLIGFISLIVLLIFAFRKIWKLRRVPFKNRAFVTVRNILLASFIFISFTSFFGNTLYQTPELMIRFILLGSALSYINFQKVYVTKKN